jgi:hypothetical protein
VHLEHHDHRGGDLEERLLQSVPMGASALGLVTTTNRHGCTLAPLGALAAARITASITPWGIGAGENSRTDRRADIRSANALAARIASAGATRV